MSESLHPAATHHLPPFITGPGQTDVLFIVMAVFVLLAVVGIGIFYFKLHAYRSRWRIVARRCSSSSSRVGAAGAVHPQPPLLDRRAAPRPRALA